MTTHRAGVRYGKLTAVECVGSNKYARKMWRCVCDCGASVVRNGTQLRGAALSSGAGCPTCSSKSRVALHTKHGFSTRAKRERVYNIWMGMVERCRNPKRPKYKNYGGKGIRVCDEWKRFENFRDWALSHGYADNLTIDRVDSGWHYDKSNCEWVTLAENVRRAHLPGHYWRSMTCDA